MADLARLDELRRQYAEHPRRYFAPLASALRRAGDARAAVEVVRRGLADTPEHLTGYVILGQALADTGDEAGARRAFERAHELDEGNVVALQSLVTIARAQGDDEAGARWAALLREADPEPAHSAHTPHGAHDEEADEPGGESFELLDYVEVAAPPPAAATAAASVPVTADPPDPVVGLDEVPADPLPAPMREALPALLDDAASEGEPMPATGAAGAHDERSEFASYPFDADLAPATPPAAPFVTETMAGLLAAQGHTAQALDVYAQLLAQRPDDPRLTAQMAALRGEASDAPGAAPHEPLAHDATADDSAAPASAARDADERAAQMWRAAFAPLPAAARQPEPRKIASREEAGSDADAAGAAATLDAPAPDAAADPSLDDLSFDHFFEAFGDEPAPAPVEPAGEFERWAAEVERRSAPDAGEVPSAPPAGTSAVAGAAGVASAAAVAGSITAPVPHTVSDDPDADLAEFNAWLRSLGA